jgi:hypothetical protein
VSGGDDAEDWEPSFKGELRPLDNYTVSEFTCGGCGAFATALHDRTGWRIMAEYEPGPEVWIAHVWVVNPDGRAVDIQGIHDDEWAPTCFSGDAPAGRVVAITRDEAADKDEGPGSHFEWACEILDAWPERFSLPAPQGAQATPRTRRLH